MVRCRNNWAVIFVITVAMASVAARAQQSPSLSTSITVAEATISAPEPAPSSAPVPLVSSGPSAIRTASPTASDHHVADRHFWALVAVTGTCAVLDGESTMHGLQAPGRREMNPVLGSHPDRARFYATAGATDAALGYLAYRLKRGGHDKLWRIPLVGAGVAHLSGAINNLQY